MKNLIERIAVALRNQKRSRLIAEYGRNLMRNKRIVAQLGIIQAGRDLEQQGEEIINQWPTSGELHPQAQGPRRLATVEDFDSLRNELRQFRRDFVSSSMPAGSVSEEATSSGEAAAIMKARARSAVEALEGREVVISYVSGKREVYGTAAFGSDGERRAFKIILAAGTVAEDRMPGVIEDDACIGGDVEDKAATENKWAEFDRQHGFSSAAKEVGA